MSERISYGTLEIPAFRVLDLGIQQNATAYRQGPEGQRGDQQGLVKWFMTDGRGGLFKRHGSWAKDGNRQEYNEGLQTHGEGEICKPYALTTQGTLVAADQSLLRSLNRRVHGLITSLGTNALRPYFGLSIRLFSNTSTSNPALVQIGSSTTDLLSAMAMLRLNATDYMGVATNGATDDLFGIADPQDAPNTRTVLYGQAVGDRIGAMHYFPSIDQNVFIGKFTTNGFWAAPGATSTVPMVPYAVVRTETKDVLGSLTAQSVTAPATFARNDSTIGTNAWSNPTNVTASDGSSATCVMGTSENSQILVVDGFDFSAIPADAVIVGLVPLIERRDSAGAGNIRDLTVQLLVENEDVGYNFADTATNWPGSDTNKTYLGATNLGEHNWSINDLRTIALYIRVIQEDGGGTSTAAIDYVSLQVYYKLPGTMPSLPLGLYGIGPCPWQDLRLCPIAPEFDEDISILLPRQPWYTDFIYDPGRGGVTVSLTKVETGLPHVEAACWFAGGLAAAGDNSGGIGKVVKHIGADGTIRNLGFLGGEGYPVAVGIVSMRAAGNVLICEVALEAATDTQFWYYFDGTWHASTPLQSKSNAISALPIGWAEPAMDPAQHYQYRFFPVSTTHLACAYIYQPANIFESAYINTTILKQDGSLFLRSPELDLGGPIEDIKTMLVLQNQDRRVSATAGSYGTVQYDINTAGDPTFAVTAVSTGALNSADQTYNVPTSGVDFKTAIVKITLANANGTVKTGNGANLLVTMDVAHPILSKIRVFIDTEDAEWERTFGDWTAFRTALEAQQLSKGVQRLKWNNFDKNAGLSPEEPFGADWVVEEIGRPVLRRPQDSRFLPFVEFWQKPGTVS